MELKFLQSEEYLNFGLIIERLKADKVDLEGSEIKVQIKGLRYLRSKEIYAVLLVSLNKQPVTIAKELNPTYQKEMFLRFNVEPAILHATLTDEVLADKGFVAEQQRPNLYTSKKIENVQPIIDALSDRLFTLDLEEIEFDSSDYILDSVSKVIFM